eukprot:100382_1
MNDTQTVIQFNFNFENNLNGTISDIISKLTDLQIIQIINNPLITGSIPNTICNLSYLSAIDFQNVNFHGDFPTCVGYLSSMQWLELEFIPLSMTEDVIHLLCRNANMYVFELRDINYTGTIPECIGNKWLNLQSIYLIDLPCLRSTIPQSFNNLKKLATIQIINLTNLYGSIPSEIFKNNDFRAVQILNTSLSGNIFFEDICRSKNINYLSIVDNGLLSQFSIPNCIGSLTHLLTLALGGSTPMNGTIPNSVCKLKSLVQLTIGDTAITGSLPECISYNLTNLIYLQIYYNKFLNGQFPSILSRHLKVMDINSNNFEGSISSIFALDQYPKLEIMLLHGNKFVDNDIGIMIKKIFKYSSNIKAITLYDNVYIAGPFPSFDKEIYLNQFSVFAAHKLNIGGSLPNNVYFASNVSYVTYEVILSLYDNQLSSNLPSHLISNSHNVTPIILRGNVFTIYEDADIPDWMRNSFFVHAKQLYITFNDVITDWIVVIIGFICFLVVLIRKKYQFIPYSDVEFIEDMKLVDICINDNKLLCLVLLLLIFYPFSCSYYSSTTILSWFSLFFFQSENIFVMTTLCLLMIIYNIVIINITRKVVKRSLSENVINTVNVQLQQLQEHMIPKKEVSDETGNENCLTTLIYFFAYLVLYLLSIFILVLYILTESLPGDNTLNISYVEQQLISHSIQIVLAINTSLIIPRFVDSMFVLFQCKKKSFKKTNFVMVTRTMTTIIIPIAIAVVLLNDCGNGWTQMWKPCVNNKDLFDIKHPMRISRSIFNATIQNHTGTLTLQENTKVFDVLRASDVCSVVSFNDISWNKCIRSFLNKWCNILMIKMIIMFFMPIFILLWKTIKSKVCKNETSTTIKIDSEYSMVATKLEMIFSFGLFCPLLLPIIIISLNSFIFFYQTTIHRLNWKINFFNHSQGIQSFPFSYLWFGIFIEQFLSFLFLQTADIYQNDYYKFLPWTVLSGYMCIDIFFIHRCFKTKTDANENE